MAYGILLPLLPLPPCCRRCLACTACPRHPPSCLPCSVLQEKAAIEARMAELQREGAKLVNHIKTYTVRGMLFPRK